MAMRPLRLRVLRPPVYDGRVTRIVPPSAEDDPGLTAGEDGIEASSLTRALNILGDVWTVLLLREFFGGLHRFQDLQERLGVPRQTLMLRLATMTEHQILYRRAVQRRGVHYEYHLTPKGLDLYPFVIAIWDWHRQWEEGTAFMLGDLVHRPCGHRLEPALRCDTCHRAVGRADVSYAPGIGQGLDPRPPARLSRQNDAALLKSAEGDTSLVATSIVGDRWSYLVVAAMFRGTTSFFALTRQLRISSNILSARLKKLIALGLIEPEPSGEGRRGHRLTERGESLFPTMQALMDWGDRWLAGVAGPPEVARHACGAIMHPRYTCGHCGQVIRPWDVEVAPAQPAPRTSTKKSRAAPALRAKPGR